MPQQKIKPSHAFASLALAAAISSLALATASHAQPPPRATPRGAVPPGAATPMPRATTPNRDSMRADMQQRMAARRAERNKDLATVLHLRPDQMPALEAFVASQAPQRPTAPPSGARPGPGGALTTPQRLDRQAQRGRDRDAVRQRREQGLRTFYAALAPEQQQVFDALTRLRDSDGRGLHGRHGMRGGAMGGRMGSR